MTAPTALSAEAAALDCLERWAAAVRAKDPDAIAARYAPDIVAFDAILQLQFKGLEAYRRHWETCLTYCQGPMIFEMHALTLHADTDVAFCHALIRCGGADETGETRASWMRMTAGLRRIEGEWRIVHEHHSAPFEMESGKALFELEP